MKAFANRGAGLAAIPHCRDAYMQDGSVPRSKGEATVASMANLRAKVIGSITNAGDKLISAAIREERERCKAIDEIANLYDPDLVREAKYEDPCTAEELAERAKLPKNRMRAARNQVKSLLQEM